MSSNGTPARADLVSAPQNQQVEFVENLICVSAEQSFVDKTSTSNHMCIICDDQEVREIRFIKENQESHVIKYLGKELNEELLAYLDRFVGLRYDCFITANPLCEWATGFASDKYVSRRQNIILDIDRRTSTDRPATQEEIDEAQKYGRELIDWLAQKLPDFKVRCISCSGNGIHILIACDLENSEEAKTEVGRFIKNLHKAFPSSAFKLDESVSNSSRHVRLIGTPNFKFGQPQPTYLLPNPKPEGTMLGLNELIYFNKMFPQDSQFPCLTTVPESPYVLYENVDKRARAYLEKLPPAISGENGHNKLFDAALCLRIGFELDYAISLEILKEYNTRCVPPWKEEDLIRKIHEVENSKLPRGYLLRTSSESSGIYSQHQISIKHGDDTQMNQIDALLPVLRSTELNCVIPASRTVVYINGNVDLHATVAQIKPVLARMPELFEYANKLVRVDSKPNQSNSETVSNWSVIRDLNTAWLSTQIPKYVQFIKYDEKNRPVMTSPTSGFYQALIEDVDWSAIRSLKGLSSTPVFRPDGSFHDQPGFDPITCYWNSSNNQLHLSNNLTQNDAQSAAARLLELVRDFPFKNDSYRYVWLGMSLTIIARPGIEDSVPNFLISANNRGTGKSLLLRLASILSTGLDPALMAWPESANYKSKGAVDVELQKILLAIAQSGQRVLALDNIRSGTSFGSPSLDAATTSLQIQGRTLGKTEVKSFPWTAVTIGTGNNVGLQSDTGRRTWPIYLETDLEHPEFRSDFAVADIVDHVKENWIELYKCLAVMLASHAQAGRPGPSNSPPRSFSKWHKIVRDAVWWATGVDFNQALMNEEIIDEEHQEECLLLRSLLEYQQNLDNNWFTARDIQESLLHSNGQWESMRDLFCPDSKESPTTNAISRKLTKTKNTVRGGLKLTAKSNKATKTMEFYVEEMT